MNTKAAWGVMGAVIILAGAFLVLHPAAPAKAPTSGETASSTETSIASSSQPTIIQGMPTYKPPEVRATFDVPSLTSTATYPTITGTTKATEIGIIISDSTDKGLVASMEVPVKSGRWSYRSPVPLPPGRYTILLSIGGRAVAGAELVIKNP